MKSESEWVKLAKSHPCYYVKEEDRNKKNFSVQSVDGEKYFKLSLINKKRYKVEFRDEFRILKYKEVKKMFLKSINYFDIGGYCIPVRLLKESLIEELVKG